MFHVSLLCLLFLAVSTAPIRFQGTQSALQIKTTRDRTFLEVSLTIRSQESIQFQIYSRALFPQSENIRVELNNGKIMLMPQVPQSEIMIRDHNNDEYHLAFKHDVGLQVINFLPLRIIHKEQQFDLFLPTFDMALPFIPQNSLYRCDKILVSLQRHQKENKEGKDYLDVLLFTRDMKEQNFFLGEQWDQTWRHYDDGIHFGGGRKQIINSGEFSIHLSSKSVCQIAMKDLPHPGDLHILQKYYKILDILQWVPALPVIDIANQQL